MVVILLLCLWISFDGWYWGDVGFVICYLLIYYEFLVYLFLYCVQLYVSGLDVYDYCICDDCLFDVYRLIYGFYLFICL